jgi:hypothetical protein
LWTNLHQYTPVTGMGQTSPKRAKSYYTSKSVEPIRGHSKDPTVKTYHDPMHHHLKAPLHTSLMASNFARRVKTLQGLTPYAHSCQGGQTEPERCIMQPYHHSGTKHLGSRRPLP